MKTTNLLRVSVMTCLLAGVTGCGSQSEGERPAVSDSTADDLGKQLPDIDLATAKLMSTFLGDDEFPEPLDATVV